MKSGNPRNSIPYFNRTYRPKSLILFLGFFLCLVGCTKKKASTELEIPEDPENQATHLAFLTQPLSGITGEAFSVPITVQILNEEDEVVESAAAISIAAYTSADCTTLSTAGSLSATSANAVAGIASFSGVNFSGQATIYLQASSSGLTSACSQAIAIAPANVAVKLAFKTNPAASATAGQVLTTQPSVELRNGSDALVSDATGTVTITAFTDSACSSTAATGTLAGASQAATSGEAQFSSLSYTKAETIYLKAVTGSLTSACSEAIAVSAAAASKFTLSTSASPKAGECSAISVASLDTYNNVSSPTSNKTVHLSGHGVSGKFYSSSGDSCSNRCVAANLLTTSAGKYVSSIASGDTDGTILCYSKFQPAAVTLVAEDPGASFTAANLNVTVANPELNPKGRVAVGVQFTCILQDNGGVKCWGLNGDGQVGDGTLVDKSAPTDVSGLEYGVKAIFAGQKHSCAHLMDNSVRCWGDGSDGQMGNNSTMDRSTPVTPTGLTEGTVTQISVGGSHACAIITGGLPRCWGRNDEGQIGNAGNTDQPNPAVIAGYTATAVTSIQAGNAHTCLVRTDGSLRCWGWNDQFGQVGVGSITSNYNTPQSVSLGMSTATQLSTGGKNSCVVTNSGQLQCWGGNYNYAIGDGTDTDRLTPVDVSGMSSGVSFVVNGWEGSCAVMTNGSLRCWGDYRSSAVNQTPAVVFSQSSGVISASLNDSHGCLMLSAGGVRCWGGNSNYQLGDGSTTDSFGALVSVSGL